MENGQTPAAREPIDFAHKMEKHSRISFFSMVLGILGVVLSLFPTLALLALCTSAVALAAGLVFRRQTLRLNIPEDTKNAVGRWCGLIGLSLSVLTIVLTIIAMIGLSSTTDAALALIAA